MRMAIPGTNVRCAFPSLPSCMRILLVHGWLWGLVTHVDSATCGLCAPGLTALRSPPFRWATRTASKLLLRLLPNGYSPGILVDSRGHSRTILGSYVLLLATYLPYTHHILTLLPTRVGRSSGRGGGVLVVPRRCPLAQGTCTRTESKTQQSVGRVRAGGWRTKWCVVSPRGGCSP